MGPPPNRRREMAVSRHVSRATCRIEPRRQLRQKGTRLSHGKRPIAKLSALPKMSSAPFDRTDGSGHRYGEGGETMEPYTITGYGVLVDGVLYATYTDYVESVTGDGNGVTNTDSDD